MKMATGGIGRLSSGRRQENFNLATGSHALKGSGSQQPRTAFPAAMIAKREPTLGEVGRRLASYARLVRIHTLSTDNHSQILHLEMEERSWGL